MRRRVVEPTACASFPPITARAPRVLVLGSMPGSRSLAEQRYYANPQNHFWRFMGELCGFDPALTYAMRVAALARCGIAVWDVLAHCERSGSLDGRIVRASEVPNDIAGFIGRRPSLRAIALNGGKAAQSFHRHVWKQAPDALRARITLLEMPSTSPANASIPIVRKRAAWSRLASYLGDAVPGDRSARRRSGRD